MKKLALVIFLLGIEISAPTFAQVTEKDLAETYWKYRDRFRKQFISIGRRTGQSLPVEQIRYDYAVPIIAPDQINLHKPEAEKISYLKGRMDFSGDMGMDLGYYLILLSTEYHLLKAENKDLTGVKNELYYALNAVNRIDDAAEHFFKPTIDIHPRQRNGFFIREDMPNGFYKPWEDIGDGIAMQGAVAQGRNPLGNQVDYDVWDIDPADSVLKKMRTEKRWIDKDSNIIYEGGPDAWRNRLRVPSDRDYDNQNKWGNKWNEMSQDQVIGIILGLKFVSQFVDSVFIKPTSADEGFNLQEMSKIIAKRIIDFLHDRKEFCNSQIHKDCGSKESYIEDASLLGNCKINHINARWIIRNPVTGKAVYRGPVSYINGLGFGMAMVGRSMYGKNDYIYDKVWVTVDRKGNDGNLGADIDLKNRFNLFFVRNNYPEDIGAKYYNASHIIRISSAAGEDVLSHQNVFDIASNWHHPWMELFYTVLNNKTPLKENSYYIGLLSKAPCAGPSLTYLERDSIFNLGKLIEKSNTDRSNFDKLLGRIGARKGIWTDFGKMSISKSFIEIVEERNKDSTSSADIADGEFNGMDYMIMYNLWRMAFGSSSSYTQQTCPCTINKQFINSSKSKIETIGTGYPHQTINTVFRFPEYKDFGIPIPEYLTHHFWILKGGVLNVTGDLTISCSSTEINTGGILNVLKSSSTAKQKYLTIGKAGGLILKDGGTLYVDDGNTVIIDEEGVLNILEGSHIILNGPNAILEIRGRLVLGAKAVLKIEGGADGRGFVRWNMPDIADGAHARKRIVFGTSSSIELIGQNNNDKIMEVSDHVFWPDGDSAQVVFKNGKIEMGKKAVMNLGLPLVFYNLKLVPKAGTSSFKGIVLWGKKHSIYKVEINGSRQGLQSFNLVGGHDFKAIGLCIQNGHKGLSLEGKGYHLINYSANLDWSGGMDYGINAMGIDRESRISIANINRCNTGVSHTGNLGSGLSVHHSVIGAYENGIKFISPSSLLAQCNDLNAIPQTANSLSTGIYASGGKSELAPSLGRNAGGNIFNNFSYSIFLDRNNLYLNQGNNNLASYSNAADRAVFGETTDVPLSGIVLADKNNWDLNFNPPYTTPSALQNYNVVYKSSTGPTLRLTYTDNFHITSLSNFTTGRIARCNNSYSGGPIGGLYPHFEKINSSNFINKNVSEVFEIILKKMYNPGDINPIEASANWNEILTASLWNLPLTQLNYAYVSMGISKMMENVGFYLLSDTVEANNLTLNNVLLQNANKTLLYWKSLTSNDTNYFSRQIHQQSILGLAQIQHNANEFLSAKTMIDGLVYHSEGIWKEQADYWQCQWLREELIKASDHTPDTLAMENWPKCNYGLNNPIAVFIQNWEEQVSPEISKTKKITQKLKLYPNPARTIVMTELEISQKEDAMVSIYSANGKYIRSTSNIKLGLGTNKLIIPLSDLSAGVYTITIETRKIKWVEKVIIE